ncbi:DnaJ domain-containing protein [Ideonella sp. B7]|uniref:DnaJ domain-containing protein n=1 Tax=Ideonella benzenivorans TaxID=2831643 RepID=UPI001CEC29A4|nr:DnaJ domain-containing protein [Ideonella benzenivorans]MCA6218341.1 DnaJ domain-containing protein [Ideonella benzenivorans]
MRRERRNLYRLLHVQPEAPPEVIKAAWRALMSTLRAHPDLGGDPEQAALLNAAYAVLSDPERRAAYDRTLKRSPRSPQATSPGTGGPARPARDARAGLSCPFCDHLLPVSAVPVVRCAHCGSPLTPVPRRTVEPELLGRRQSERFPRATLVDLTVKGDRTTHPAQLKDLSFSGLSLLFPSPIPVGSVLRVRAPQFEALVTLVACRAQAGQYSLHGRLMTLALDRTGRGVYVDAKA